MQSAHRVTGLKTKLRDPELLAQFGQALWECREYSTVMAETAVGAWDVQSPLWKVFVRHPS